MNNEFLIGKPRIYPEKLINELKNLFLNFPNIKSAYIAQIFIPNSGVPPHLLIGIDAEGDLNDIADKLGEVIKNNIQENEYIDVFPVNTEWLVDYFKTIKPFYKIDKV